MLLSRGQGRCKQNITTYPRVFVARYNARMTSRDDQTLTANPTPVPAPGGGGYAGNAQTNIADGIGASLKRRRGGQMGNRNAAKPVHALSTRLRDFKRRCRAAIRQAEGKC